MTKPPGRTFEFVGALILGFVFGVYVTFQTFILTELARQ